MSVSLGAAYRFAHLMREREAERSVLLLARQAVATNGTSGNLIVNGAACHSVRTAARKPLYAILTSVSQLDTLLTRDRRSRLNSQHLECRFEAQLYCALRCDAILLHSLVAFDLMLQGGTQEVFRHLAVDR